MSETDFKKTLTESDLAMLARSYITPELAAQAGLYRVDSIEGARLVGRNGNMDCSGIVFDNYWPGVNLPREHRLRRDKPELEVQDGQRKEKNKYLSPPGGANLLYFVPGTSPESLSDCSLPIVITEGEKKTLALYRLAHHDSEGRRFLPIGLPGVWNWRGTIGKENNEKGARCDVKGPIPDLDRLKWDARIVYIIFDFNVATNGGVKAARRELAKELTRRGAQVRFVDLPQVEGVNGVDDLLAIKGPVFVLALIMRAKLAKVKVPLGFRLSDTGLYVNDPTGEKEDIFICSPLSVVASTRNQESEDWGRLLEFRDPDGVTHQWSMPMSLLAGDGNEFRSHLLSSGLNIAPNRKAREFLASYIQTSNPDERALCVDRVGWHRDAYVLPNQTFNVDEIGQILFQTTSSTNHRLHVAGTLEDWQENVSRYCVGNSRLVFAVSCAFAGPLLPLLEESGGGFHYRRISSTGKTTAQLVAGSVWGGDSRKGYLQSWRSTINGLESICELHNHGLLCLDDIGQCDQREVGEVAYMLANGIGKGRMTRRLTSRKRFEWDLIFLSSGELGLSDLANSSGKGFRGGQAVRMCDLDVDAGAGFGAFETLHGLESPAELARHLSTSSKKFFGSPIRTYLEKLVSCTGVITGSAQDLRKAFLDEHLTQDSVGEVYRVVSRFALVAAAGEAASAITGWRCGEAYDAAAKLFKVWLEGRGTKGSADVAAAIRQVRAFIESHGSSRFQSIEGNPERVFHRAGFKRINHEDETEYLVLAEAFRKEVCSGYDAQAVAKTLAERGYLKRGDGKNLLCRETLPEIGRTRVYVLLPALFAGSAVDRSDKSDICQE
jgi:uncharacterized protein (DUF927 family)